MRALRFALMAIACSCELAFPVHETQDAAADGGDASIAETSTDAAIDADAADAAIDATGIRGCAAPGLITFYPTDEGEGGVLHDCSPTHNTANLFGSYAWCRHDAGASHPCISLSQNDAGYASAADLNNIYNFTGDATVSFWLRVDIAPPPTGCPSQGCFGYVINYRSNNNVKLGWAIVVDPSLVLSFLVATGGAQTPALTLHQWTHIVAVLRAGTSITIYVDGSSVGPTPFDSGVLPVTSNLSLLLGDFESSNGQAFDMQYDQLNGSLDEVRIFTRALDDAEAAALYNGGVP